MRQELARLRLVGNTWSGYSVSLIVATLGPATPGPARKNPAALGALTTGPLAVGRLPLVWLLLVIVTMVTGSAAIAAGSSTMLAVPRPVAN